MYASASVPACVGIAVFEFVSNVRLCLPPFRRRYSRSGNYMGLAGVPVGGKSSVCLICMKYRIIILIIIIKRPGEILLSYIANTSRTHSRTHPVLMYPSQHFIIDEIHLLSLTIFAQEALVTRNV